MKKSAFAIGPSAEPSIENKALSTSTENSNSVNLGLGEPRRIPFPLEQLRADQEIWEKQTINYYYPPTGDPELTDLIKEKFYPGEPLSFRRSVFITNGAIHALDLIFRTFLRLGEEVLLPDPGFPPYAQLVKFAGGESLYYGFKMVEDREGVIRPRLDIKNIESKITANTRFLLINSPHNPTGHALSLMELAELRDLLLRHPQLMYISDEVYAQFHYDSSSHLSLGPVSPHGFVVNSFSKSHALQGMRIGWIHAEAELMEKMVPHFLYGVGSVSSIGQEMAKSLLKRDDYLQEMKASYVRAHMLATSILDSCGISYVDPQGSFFIWLNVGNDDVAFSQYLASRGVIVIPGSLFGSKGKGHIRVCFALPDEGIIQGLSVIGAAWKDFANLEKAQENP